MELYIGGEVHTSMCCFEVTLGIGTLMLNNKSVVPELVDTPSTTSSSTLIPSHARGLLTRVLGRWIRGVKAGFLQSETHQLRFIKQVKFLNPIIELTTL